MTDSHLVVGLGVAALVSLLLTNYSPWRSYLWTLRFRQVHGHDLIGPVVEGVFLTLTLVSLWFTIVVLFPTTILSRRFHFLTPYFWLVGLVSFLNSIVLGPTQLIREFPHRFPEQHQAISSAGGWHDQLRLLRWTYLTYLPYSVVLNATLVAVAALLIAGLQTDLGTLHTLADRFAPTPLSPEPASPTEVMTHLRQTALSYELFMDAYIERLARFFGSVGVVLFLMLWVFASSFHDVCSRSTVLVIRVATLLVLSIIVCPGGMAYYSTYMSTEVRAARAVGIDSETLLHVTWSPDLESLAAVRDRFAEHASLMNAVVGMGKSGPGLGFIAAAVLLILKAMRARSELIARVVPSTAWARALMAGGSESTHP